MIIDNTELIRTLLEFPFVPHNEGIDYFYSVQLIKRAKDFPTNAGAVPNGKSNANRSIQHFQIYSLEDYDRKVTDFVELAAFHQARAYINLNIRNSREVFGLMMQRAADRILSSDYTRLHSMYEEAVGRAPAAQGTQRRWVVDVDTHDEQEIQTVVRTIEGLRGGGGDGLGKILARVPTCAGKDSIVAGTKWLQSLTAIEIDRNRCPQTYREFVNYEYEKNAAGEFTGRLPDRDNHAIDSLRYGCEKLARETSMITF